MDIAVSAHKVKDSAGQTRGRNVAFLIMAGMLGVSAAATFAHVGYPVAAFLLGEQGTFGDFFMDRDEDLSDYFMDAPRYGALPPVAMVLGRVYGYVPPVASLMLFVTVTAVSATLLTLFATRRLSSLALLAVSFPVWFALLRGNNDTYLYLLVLMYGVLLLRRRYGLAAALIGAATALEPVTLVMSIPILLRLRIREYAVLTLSALLAWTLPVFVGPRDLRQYWEVANQGLANYSVDMAAGDGGVLFGNSAWSIAKIVGWNLAGVSSAQEGLNAGAMVLPYYRLAGALLVVFLGWLAYRRRNTPVVVLLASTIVLVLIPDVSATYKLTSIFAALLLYIFHTSDPDLRVIVLLSLALAPKTFLSGSLVTGGTYTLDSILNPILLLVALAVLGITPGVSGSDDQACRASAQGELADEQTRGLT